MKGPTVSQQLLSFDTIYLIAYIGLDSTCNNGQYTPDGPPR